MRVTLILCAILLSGAAQAQDATDARKAVALDAVSTLGALTLPGVTELNDAALVMLPVTFGFIAYAEKLPKAEGVPILHTINAVRRGASVNNVLVIGAKLFGWKVLSAVALPVGIAYGFKLYQDGQQEREFYATECDRHRAMVGQPDLICTFRPVEDVEPAVVWTESAITAGAMEAP